ncbi:hypothetical protein ACFV5E_42785 [Streptomyces chartreusis]|uniref:hypothetical protein n=1 Tax=Streptomyces chartreusis TaxID=1969 RepID=UPI00369FD0CC
MITGHTPAVVISEKPDARETLEAFTDSDYPYIIAIRMVSEGVDIPRLRILVWLSRTQTELFFAQGTACVVRIPDRADSGPAVAFMPSLDALRELAQGIDKDIVHEITELEQQVAAYEADQLALPSQADPGSTHSTPAQSGSEPEPAAEGSEQLGFSSFTVQDVELERTFLGSDAHAVEHHHYAQRIIDEDGMAQTDVAVVRRLIARGRIQPSGPAHDSPQPSPQTQAAMQMRQAVFRIREEYQAKLNTVCKYIARRYYHDDFKMVRGRVDRETGASAEFGSIDQTKQGIDFAMAWATPWTPEARGEPRRTRGTHGRPQSPLRRHRCPQLQPRPRQERAGQRPRPCFGKCWRTTSGATSWHCGEKKYATTTSCSSSAPLRSRDSGPPRNSSDAWQPTTSPPSPAWTPCRSARRDGPLLPQARRHPTTAPRTRTKPCTM